MSDKYHYWTLLAIFGENEKIRSSVHAFRIPGKLQKKYPIT